MVGAMTRPTPYCPKYLERRLLALSGVERVSIISLGDMSTRIVVTGGDNIVIAGSILRNFRLRMPGVFSLIGEVQVSLLHRGRHLTIRFSRQGHRICNCGCGR